MLKKALLYFVGGLFCFSSFAQSGGKAPEQLPEGSGWIHGQVADQNTHRPLEFATVSVYQSKDSTLLAGTITNRRGDFRLEKLPATDVFVKVEYLGYATKTFAELAVKNSKGLELGKLNLALDYAKLEEVVVAGDEKFRKSQLDHISYNVAKTPVSEGGMITDVLATLPNVTADPDGNISLRGNSGVKIMIDGKLSGLIGVNPSDVLSQLPANSVARVEVITNPSAKYTASGAAGIINIIMKKDRTKGFNGSVFTRVGTRDKYDATTAMSCRTGLFNFYGKLAYKDQSLGRDLQIQRMENLTTSPRAVDHSADRVSRNVFYSGTVGVDFLPNKFNTIGVSFSPRKYDLERDNVTKYRYSALDGSPLGNSERRGDVDGDLDGEAYHFTYLRTFKKKGQSLSVDAAYSTTSTEYFGKYEDFIGSTGPISSTDMMLTDRKETVGQVDYVHPFKKNYTFETGYLGKRFEFDSRKSEAPTEYQEDVHGAYAMMSRKGKVFSWQLGLRGEYSDVSNNVNYESDYFDFFPSLNLSWNLAKKQIVKTSYSRKIFRPTASMINPNQYLSDTKRLSVGNPSLRPEYSHFIELEYVKKWKKLTFATTVYWKNVDKVIQLMQTVDEEGVSHKMYENLDQLNYGGMDVNFSWRPFKWWRINYNLTGRYSDLDGDIEGKASSNDDFFWFTQFNSSFYLPKKWSITLYGVYESENPQLQGDYSDMYFMDLYITKRILKNKGALSLKITDLFKTREFSSYTYGSDFRQHLNFDYERQIVYLSFRYNFGKRYRINRSKKKVFKTRNNLKSGSL
ncbi:MAG: TonB-dependent receptor domain-containing protein [Marinifilaceae bacterium]